MGRDLLFVYGTLRRATCADAHRMPVRTAGRLGRKSTRASLRGAWIALVLLTAPGLAPANIGAPSGGGHVVADPVGLAGIPITRETLTIDLRPLAKNGLARVEAVYHLRNGGAERRLDLLFASGSEYVADFKVWLGAKAVAAAPAKDARLPASWRAPEWTPGLRGERALHYLQYSVERVTPMAFTVTVPPGSHDLRVRYAASASRHRGLRPTIYHQFAYVLAPARAWSGFGGLDVTIHLPENWLAASAPGLAREGDTLRGSFAALPADAIALTLRAPVGWAYRLLTCASLGLFGLAVLGGPVVCRRYGRSKGRRLAAPIETRAKWIDRHAWPGSIGLGAAWGAALVASGAFAIFVPTSVLPAGQKDNYFHYSWPLLALLFAFLLSILAVPVGFAIAQCTSVAVRRRELAGACRTTDATPGPAEPQGGPEL